MTTNRKFHLDRANGKFLGVCAGLSAYFDIDPMLVRVGFVVATLVAGFPLIAYFVIALVAD